MSVIPGIAGASWSDGCAQTHNITASSSGVESIAPPFTQVYRSYTYAQNDCGAVQYSQSCPNTPYAGNGMIFSGWTGGLSGTADPVTTTVHDEFLPLANFNIVPTVIHATGVSPPLPVKDVRRHPDRDRHRLCERKFFRLLE
jgi:hypothetical protein